MMQTPYFLIHKNMLDEGVEKLKSALQKYWPNAQIGYSFKTNSLPWVVKYMKDLLSVLKHLFSLLAHIVFIWILLILQKNYIFWVLVGSVFPLWL